MRFTAVAAFTCATSVVPTGVWAQVTPASVSTLAPKAIPAASPSPSPTPAVAASPTPVPRLLQLAAFGDVGYDSVGGTNVVRFVNGAPSRVFDGGNGPFYDANGGRLLAEPDNFNDVVNLQSINLQLAINSAGQFGGKLEGSFGTDADALASNGSSRAGADPSEVYFQYAAGPLTVIAGKYPGLPGEEFAETTNNTNFSRDYLALGEMARVTGVRATYAFNPKFSLIVGANNGWDDWKFAGKKKTVGGSLVLTPSQAYALDLTFYNGGDFLLNGNSAAGILPVYTNRMLYDGVLTVHATSALTLIANYDAATQLGDSAAGRSVPALSSSQRWGGIAGYANYQFTPKYMLSLRKETFRDAQGFRTGVGVPLRLQSNTATFNYTPTSHYILRLEYRLDRADGNDFAFLHASDDPAAFVAGRNFQSSIGVEMVVKVP
jgi:hypothetical protein